MQASSRRPRRRPPGTLQRRPAARPLARRRRRPRSLPACRRYLSRHPCACPRRLAAAWCRALARRVLPGSHRPPAARCRNPAGQPLPCQQHPIRTGCRAQAPALRRRRMADSSGGAAARVPRLLRSSGRGWMTDRRSKLPKSQAGYVCGSDIARASGPAWYVFLWYHAKASSSSVTMSKGPLAYCCTHGVAVTWLLGATGLRWPACELQTAQCALQAPLQPPAVSGLLGKWVWRAHAHLQVAGSLIWEPEQRPIGSGRWAPNSVTCSSVDPSLSVQCGDSPTLLRVLHAERGLDMPRTSGD